MLSIVAVLAMPAGAMAQDAGDDAREAVETSQRELSVAERTLPSCDDTPPDGDVIVVCALRVDPETVMLPGGTPVDGDRGMPRAPDLRPPLCHPNALICLTSKFGSAPPRPPMVDTTAFPEPLSEEDSALVFAVPDDSAPQPAAVTGEREPIPLED